MKKLAIAVNVIILVIFNSLGAEEPKISVIVNKENSVKALTLPELKRVFLKQTHTWKNGEVCVPIDWGAAAEIRKRFSKKVFNRVPEEMKDYWIQQNVTNGTTPPPVQKSAKAIMKYVANVPGAISYIYSDDVTGNVKVIAVKGLD
ncbi:MAG: hypothetical protein HYR55_12500 [Acidobacteria bacterium]|nr:hypothetical protein [Acidobacteriota bacterium]MBI3657471.1 hypothetical protein [Acidobacteriota bacterium]